MTEPQGKSDAVETEVAERKLRPATLLQRPSPASANGNDWLGAESHVPNLGPALRRRNRPAGRSAGLTWMAGLLFVTGLAVGSLATTLLVRSRRSR